MGDRAIPGGRLLVVPPSARCWVNGVSFFAKRRTTYRSWRCKTNQHGVEFYVVRADDGREVTVLASSARFE